MVSRTEKVREGYEIAKLAERRVLACWQMLLSLRQDVAGDPEFDRTVQSRLIGSGLLAGLRDECNRWLEETP